MLTAAIPATERVLERARLTVGDIDLFEVNEAFASAVIAWSAEIEPDMSRVNVNGGRSRSVTRSARAAPG